MEDAVSFFRDPALRGDWERQCRALDLLREEREGAPLLYPEARHMAGALFLIDESLRSRFSDASIATPPDRPISRRLGDGDRVSAEQEIARAQLRVPELAGIFPCFGDSILEEFRGNAAFPGPAGKVGPSLAQLSDEDKIAAVLALSKSLAGFTTSAISSGVILTSSTDEARDEEALPAFFTAVATLFFDTLPGLLFNFSGSIEDPGRFQMRADALTTLASAAIDVLAGAAACLKFHSSRAGTIFDKEADAHLKLPKRERVLAALAGGMLPAIGGLISRSVDMLEALNKVAGLRKVERGVRKGEALLGGVGAAGAAGEMGEAEKAEASDGSGTFRRSIGRAGAGVSEYPDDSENLGFPGGPRGFGGDRDFGTPDGPEGPESPARHGFTAAAANTLNLRRAKCLLAIPDDQLRHCRSCLGSVVLCCCHFVSELLAAAVPSAYKPLIELSALADQSSPRSTAKAARRPSSGAETDSDDELERYTYSFVSSVAISSGFVDLAVKLLRAPALSRIHALALSLLQSLPLEDLTSRELSYRTLAGVCVGHFLEPGAGENGSPYCACDVFADEGGVRARAGAGTGLRMAQAELALLALISRLSETPTPFVSHLAQAAARSDAGEGDGLKLAAAKPNAPAPAETLGAPRNPSGRTLSALDARACALTVPRRGEERGAEGDSSDDLEGGSAADLASRSASRPDELSPGIPATPQRPRAAEDSTNFVADYLINMVRMYGKGGFHPVRTKLLRSGQLHAGLLETIFGSSGAVKAGATATACVAPDVSGSGAGTSAAISPLSPLAPLGTLGSRASPASSSFSPLAARSSVRPAAQTLSASRRLDSYRSPAVLGGLGNNAGAPGGAGGASGANASSTRKVHHEGLDGTGPVTIKRCKATEPMGVMDTINLRARAPEGVSVDHEALNRANLQELSRMLRQHQEEMDELHARDAAEDQDILRSTEIYTHMKNIRMWERMEARQKRDAKLEREFRARLYLMQRRSFTKGLQNGTWEREHAQDARMMQQTRNLRTATGALNAVAVPASGTFGAAMLSTATAQQLMQRMEPAVESLYVYYALVVLSNVARLTAQSPDRRPRKALAAMDHVFFRGLKAFLDEGSELLTGAVLDLLYQLLVFPGYVSETLKRPWDVLEETGVLGAVRSLVALQNKHALYFVCRFFASPGWEERISLEALEVLASTSGELVQAFLADARSANAASARLSLATLAYLANSYYAKAGKSLCGIHLSDDDYRRLAGELVLILREHGHPNELAAIVTIFGLLSRPRSAAAAARVLEGGLLQELVGHFVGKYPPDSQICGKLSFSDIFLVRIFTDLLGSGCPEVSAALRGHRALHRALCKMYESWLRSSSFLPVDQQLVVLPGPVWRAPAGKTGRGIVYDLVTDFLAPASEVRRSGSPRRSSPSPLRVRVAQVYRGLTAKEDAGDLALADEPGRPPTESDTPAGWGVSVRSVSGAGGRRSSPPLPGHIRAALGGANTLEMQSQIGLEVRRATEGLASFSQAGERYVSRGNDSRSQIGASTRLIPSFSTRALNAAEKDKRPPYGRNSAKTRGMSRRTQFSAVPDEGSLPDSQVSLPPEVAMLVRTNIAALVYAFFRAVHPALADKDALIRKVPHRDQSLLSGELERAKLRGSSARLERLERLESAGGLGDAPREANTPLELPLGNAEGRAKGPAEGNAPRTAAAPAAFGFSGGAGESGSSDSSETSDSADDAQRAGASPSGPKLPAIPSLALSLPAAGARSSGVAAGPAAGSVALPGLSLKLPGKGEQPKKEVVLDLESHDALLLLSMEAFLIKNSLDGMSPVFGGSSVITAAGTEEPGAPPVVLIGETAGDEGEEAPGLLGDDLRFLEYGRRLLLKRLDLLRTVGEDVVKEERAVKLNAEADYYTKMLN